MAQELAKETAKDTINPKVQTAQEKKAAAQAKIENNPEYQEHLEEQNEQTATA